MASPALRTVRLSGTDLAPRWRGRLHLGAAVLAVPASAALIWRERTPATAVYGTALVALLAVSACYHLFPMSVRRRELLRRVDHVMIYLYIAAAYAPFCLYVVRGRLGWIVLGASWIGAAVGVAAKVFAFGRSKSVSAVLYMLVGWLVVVTLPKAVRGLDPVALGLLVATGALYTGGAVVLLTRHPDPVPDVFGYHEVWHAAVVLACACYFSVVWSIPSARWA